LEIATTKPWKRQAGFGGYKEVGKGKNGMTNPFKRKGEGKIEAERVQKTTLEAGLDTGKGRGLHYLGSGRLGKGLRPWQRQYE